MPATIDSIVSVSITSSTRTPTQTGFGTPGFVGYAAALAADTTWRTITDPTDLVALSITAGHPLSRMVDRAFAQNPRPPQVKIASLATAPTRTWTITITSATEGQVIRIPYALGDGTTGEITRTIPAASNTTAEATAVELLVEALTGVSSTSASAVVTATSAAAGDAFWFSGAGTNCQVVETTSALGYDTRLTALRLVDDDFYGVAIDSQSDANVDALAAWTESNGKIAAWDTTSTVERSASVTMTAQQTAGYRRTVASVHGNAWEYLSVAALAALAANDAGAITLWGQTFAGVSADTWTSTEETYIAGDYKSSKGVGGNTYMRIGGLNFLRAGRSVGGQHIDLQVASDWASARIKERVLAYLLGAGKRPYSDKTVDEVCQIVKGVLREGVTKLLFLEDEDHPIVVSGPRVSTVSAANREARHLPDIRFSAYFAGAVQSAAVIGVLSL